MTDIEERLLLTLARIVHSRLAESLEREAIALDHAALALVLAPFAEHPAEPALAPAPLVSEQEASLAAAVEENSEGAPAPVEPSEPPLT